MTILGYWLRGREMAKETEQQKKDRERKEASDRVMREALKRGKKDRREAIKTILKKADKEGK